MTVNNPTPKLHDVMIRMYRLSVWDANGKQYLPVFDYEWRDATTYMPAEQAIMTNSLAWFQDNQ